ncbi:MAG TPA: helix-hairpin-helix domain-containing protein [Bacteroidales bacterium]|nr:helix-hairpin-helix domain-containing protein [Bacteroidales bacterium]
MISLKEPLKSWFGFTRRERRSTFILLIIVIFVVAARFVVPEKNTTIQAVHIDSEETKEESISSVPVFTAALKQSEKPSYQKKQAPVNINTCDSAALVALPGIGPVLSVRIIKYRNLLGGYFSTDQLKEVYGLPEETFNLISSRVYADSLSVKKIRINHADYKELIRLPYFERYEVSAILKYRELRGRIKGMNDLVENKLVSAEKVSRIRPYLDFGE